MAREESFFDEDDTLLNQLMSDETIAPGTIRPERDSVPAPKPSPKSDEAKPEEAKPAEGGGEMSVMSQRIIALESQLKRKEAELSKARTPKKNAPPGPSGGPPRPQDENPFQEHRAHARHLVDWRAAVVNETDAEQHIFYGRAADISMGGASLLMSQNIYFRESVVLLVAMPPFVNGGRERILEIRGKTVYTVLAANSQMFRVGFQFIEFRRDSKRLLENYLAERFSYF